MSTVHARSDTRQLSHAFETARDFAEHGYRVFPTHTVIDGRCTCGKECGRDAGKHPRTKHGFKEASSDERKLLHWNDRWPDANWALACGTHVSVIDPDSKHGADPREIIADYELDGRPTVWTGEALEGDLIGVRGAHIYCAPGTRGGNTAAVGVEIRGDGQYVMLPGSQHLSGVRYEWADDARPWTVELQPIPTTLVPAAKAKAARPRDPDIRVPHGERHTYLKDFAVQLVRIGVTSERVILAHLWTHFRETCDREPEPKPGSLEKLAAWATGSDIAEREQQRRDAKQGGKAALLEASTILGMCESDPLIHAWRESAHQGTPMTARTESGVWLRWERQRDMLKPEDLLYPILAETGLPGPEKPLNKPQAMAVYKHLVTAAETFGRIDMRDETHDWLDAFERTAVQLEARLADPASKFLAARDLQHYSPDTDECGQRPARWQAPPVLTDLDTGDRYVGVQDLADNLRKERRVTIDYAALTARMAEIGWGRHLLQAWEPEVPRAEAQHHKLKVYRRPGEGR